MQQRGVLCRVWCRVCSEPWPACPVFAWLQSWKPGVVTGPVAVFEFTSQPLAFNCFLSFYDNTSSLLFRKEEMRGLHPQDISLIFGIIHRSTHLYFGTMTARNWVELDCGFVFYLLAPLMSLSGPGSWDHEAQACQAASASLAAGAKMKANQPTVSGNSREFPCSLPKKVFSRNPV